MDDEDFTGILDGLKDALEYAKGDKSRGRVIDMADADDVENPPASC